MTNEEIVLEKLNNNKFLGKSPIHFDAIITSDSWWTETEKSFYLETFNKKIQGLKSLESVLDRVREIINISKGYRTYNRYNNFQCYAGARRSTTDIWRIYKYYFGEIDIFSIMRALYQLVTKEDLRTYRCSTIRKRVFWKERWGAKDLNVKAELGVPLSEWENIGINYEQTKAVS